MTNPSMIHPTQDRCPAPGPEIRSGPKGGKLYIAMVGLPARGKSTVAAKLAESLTDEGVNTRIFNNGDVRRQMLGESTSSPDFYDPENTKNVALREKIARVNIENARDYLNGDGEVAILDATNVSCKRRESLQSLLTDHPVFFIECRNDDEEILKASIIRKTKLPEFSRVNFEQAITSFVARIAYYEHIYSPLEQEENFIVLDSLNNKILEERITDDIPHYVKIRDLLVSDWVKNLYLVRHGETHYNLENRIGGDSGLTRTGKAQAAGLAQHFKKLPVPYIFTSTNKRTIQTAIPIKEAQERSTIICLAEFDEIDAGECDCMRYKDIRDERPEIFEQRTRDKYNYIYPGGEGYVTLKDRVDLGIKKALYLSGNSDHVMIVGHQAINRMILSHFLYRRTEDVPYIYIPQDRYFHIVSMQNKKIFELSKF
ncbi:MAG: bifunctional nucleoside/nucleotide kinase/histidine phosphatase family protein [Desulfovibrionales bacterium]